MDKYEFKLKIDEMKALVSANNYKAAAEIAETINWRKIRNINAMVLAGEVFEQAERYEESKEILLMAYDRSPIGRNIIYRLAEIAIKTKNFDEAQEYYDEFVDIAPHDNLKYVLKYKMTAAQGLPYKDQIQILEELKVQEYSEEWAYELAYLYHMDGKPDKCVEACDELIIWFGDGIYVEKALELKMHYQPLTKQQESKYRMFRQKRTGVIEVKPDDFLESGEIINETVSIPSVVTKTDKYNTVNLQQEIEKGMQQIMNAQEQEDVSDAMDNIKKLVEDIPYLSMDQEQKRNTDKILDKQVGEEIDRQLDQSINQMFREEEAEKEEQQPESQMSIEEILEDWERTKQRTKEILDQADEKKLESAKERALQEAETLMDRLMEVMPQLSAGVTPKQLLEKEYLQGTGVLEQQALQSTEAQSVEASIEEAGRIVAGMNHLMQEQIDNLTGAMAQETKQEEPRPLPKRRKDPTRELPEVQETVEPQQAQELHESVEIQEPEASETRQVSEVHKSKRQMTKEFPPLREPEVLKKQVTKEIPPVEGDSAPQEEPLQEEMQEEELPHEEVLQEEELPYEEPMQEEGLPYEEMTQEELPYEEMTQEELLYEGMPQEESAYEEPVSEETLDRLDGQPEFTQFELELREAEEHPRTEEEIKAILAQATKEMPRIKPEILPEVETPEAVQTANRDRLWYQQGYQIEDYKKGYVPEKVFKQETRIFPPVREPVLDPELEKKRLTPEQKETFSYFVLIAGMEAQIYDLLEGVSHHLRWDKNALTGNILIEGIRGNGKTVLIMDIIKVLQRELNRPAGKIGKIDATSLNQKDLNVLMEKVRGGCLIVESAGKITRETAVKLSQCMEQDHFGTLYVLEDTQTGIQKALDRDSSFASKFTEKITIPFFTSDELVAFAKAYANDMDYDIDEMGILALYNRISSIQKLDHVTTLSEVKEIVDEAIERAEKGAFKKVLGMLTSTRYNEDNYIILHEKDFEE